MKKHSVIYIVCFLLVSCLSFLKAGAQKHMEILRNQGNMPLSFRALQDSMNVFFKDHSRAKGSGYKPWKRYEEWMRLHLNPDGTPGNVSAYSWEAIKNSGAQSPSITSPTINAGGWTNVGPVYNQGAGTGIGRPNCIAFHPTNSNIVYIGAPIGGVWRGDKTSGSFVWTPLSDGLAGIGVASIALHPANPNIIFILTGDGNRGDSYSTGMMVSYDAGYSWQETGLRLTQSDQRFAYKLLINPQNPNTMYAAYNTGVYKTLNGGTSWTQEPVLPGCYDIEYNPADTTKMYAAGFASLYTLSAGTWTNKSTYLPAGTRRIALAVSPADNQKVYAYCGRRDSILVNGSYISTFKGILRSDNAGSTYTLVCNNPNISGYDQDGGDRAREQSDIDMDIAVSPSNASLVYAGTENVWKSTNAGASFGSLATSYWGGAASKYVHEDINFLSVNPLDASVYCGSDGGIYRTTNAGTSWVDMGYGLVISQFYRIAVQQNNPDIIVNGAQDAAANVRVGNTSEFKEVSGGDGMDCMIDEQNVNVLYTTYCNGVIYRSDDGGTTVTDITGTLQGNWITPLAMDYYKSDTIYYGYCRYNASNVFQYQTVYRSLNKGATWLDIGSPSGSEALALGVNNTARLYTYGRKELWQTVDANKGQYSISWGNAMGTNYPSQAILANAPITKLAVNPVNDQEIWFSMGGYTAGYKVFKSYNAGATWVNESFGLPNVAVLSIVYGSNNGSTPGGVYIGTDIGVFYRNDALGTWVPFRNWLPAVPVWDLKINYSAGLIRAGTYGRGIWESPLYSSCPSSLSLTTYLEGYHYYQSSGTIFSQSTIQFGSGNTVNMKAASYLLLTPGFVAGNGAYFNASVGPCVAGIPALQDTAITSQPNLIHKESSPLKAPFPRSRFGKRRPILSPGKE
jgi:hypothetical protein